MRPILAIATWATCVLAASAAEWRPIGSTDTWTKDGGISWRGGCAIRFSPEQRIEEERQAEQQQCRDSCAAKSSCSHYNWSQGKCSLLCGTAAERKELLQQEDACGVKEKFDASDCPGAEPRWYEGCKFDSQILRTLPSSESADDCLASCNAEHFCSHFNWHGKSCQLLCGDVPRTFQIKNGSAFICGYIEVYRGRTCSATTTAADTNVVSATSAADITTAVGATTVVGATTAIYNTTAVTPAATGASTVSPPTSCQQSGLNILSELTTTSDKCAPACKQDPSCTSYSWTPDISGNSGRCELRWGVLVAIPASSGSAHCGTVSCSSSAATMATGMLGFCVLNWLLFYCSD